MIWPITICEAFLRLRTNIVEFRRQKNIGWSTVDTMLQPIINYLTTGTRRDIVLETSVKV